VGGGGGRGGKKRVDIEGGVLVGERGRVLKFLKFFKIG